MLYPWNFSTIFYSEYGAYADKEYGLITDIWSELIEGTHAIFCGIFALLSLILKIYNKHDNYLIMRTVSMGTQIMNSILYITCYIIQTKNKNNVNYNSPDFPTGFFFLKRPFMWINLFWTLMPIILIYEYKFPRIIFKKI